MKKREKMSRRKISRNRLVAIGAILLLIVVAGAVYVSNWAPNKDKEPTEDEKTNTISITLAPFLSKNGRWRVNLDLEITNLGDGKINVLWNWANVTKIRFLGNATIFEENISGNFTEAKSLNSEESTLTTFSFTNYGFSEEPTDMWIDIKIKIKEYNDIIYHSFHMYAGKVTSETFSISTDS